MLISEYQVKSGANESEVCNFKTFPEDEDFLPNIAVYGDLGVENGRALPKVIEDAQNDVIDMVLHIGDLAYDMNEQLGQQGDLFMNMVQPVASKMPYNALVGNHEEHNNFSEFSGRFTSPGPNVFYNSFNVGPIHFIMFSSEFYFFDNYGVGQLQVLSFSLHYCIFVNLQEVHEKLKYDLQRGFGAQKSYD